MNNIFNVFFFMKGKKNVYDIGKEEIKKNVLGNLILNIYIKLIFIEE